MTVNWGKGQDAGDRFVVGCVSPGAGLTSIQGAG